MKSMKLFSGMLAAVMAAAAMGATLVASAADSVGVKIGSETVEAGKSFSVNVDLSGVPSTGLSTIDFAINYDAAVLDITDVTLGSIGSTGAKEAEGDFGETLYDYKVKDGQILVVWGTGLTDSSKWINKDGTFLTINGTVKAGTANGTVAKLEGAAIARPEYPKGGDNTDILFSALGETSTVDYTAAFTNGAITVGSGTVQNIVWGDADVNGKFEMADLVMLAKAIAGTEGTSLSTAGAANCNLNANTGVDGGDLTIALKLMAGIYTDADMPVK